MQYVRTTLQNGLRLLMAPMPGMRSASISFFFTAGSRYESNTNAGISHFIEHMLFKGSANYPNARFISEAIEGVGGVFNASTGKELTHYSARVPGERASVVLDVLADMVHHSLFDPVEIEKERSRCNRLGDGVLEVSVTPDVHPKRRQAAHVGEAKRVIGSSDDPVEFVLEATWPHWLQ